MNTNEEKTVKELNPIVKVILTILAFILFSGLYITLVYLTLGNDFGLPFVIGAAAAVMLIAGAETLVTRKLKIPQFVLMLNLILPIIISIPVMLNRPIDSDSLLMMDIQGMLDMIALYTLFLTVRIFVAVIDNFIRKKKKTASLLVVTTVILSVVCVAGFVSLDRIANEVTNYVVGTPDRTGSWGSINQEVSRDKNWKQIVNNSEFQLGKEHISSSTDDNAFCDYMLDWNTYPNLDGSTVCVPMAIEFARQHIGFDDETCNNFVDFSTTHYAYENLIDSIPSFSRDFWTSEEKYIGIRPNKSVDLVIGTEPSDEELAMAKNAGVELVKKPACYDAFVFITHKDNPVDSLTVEQIRDIYSGKIKNWKEVGGKDEQIVAYQREANSGSQTAMENLVMGGRDMIDPIEIKVIEGMGVLVDAVAEYDNKTASLGYTYRYYIDTLYKNDNIKTIAVDGVAPTDENIRSEKYPFTTNYYGVIRHGDEDKTGGKFLDWMLSDEGQQCIAQAGYITMYESDDMIVEKITDAIKNIRAYVDKAGSDAKLEESTLDILSDKVKKHFDGIMPDHETKTNYLIRVDLTDKKDLPKKVLQLDFQLEVKYGYDGAGFSSAYAEPIRIKYDRSNRKIVSYKVAGKGGYFGV